MYDNVIHIHNLPVIKKNIEIYEKIVKKRKAICQKIS